MRVVVVGATGNAGTSVLRSLARDPEVESIVGIARRVPQLDWPKTTWARADVSSSPLEPHFRGADAVVHLAWLIQPSRDERVLWGTNVEGSRRVFESAAAAGVKAIVYASSVGTYSPGPKDTRVDETWPANGISTSFYSRHKAEVEGLLDAFEQRHPDIRVVRLRPALKFKREAASGVRRLFAGPLLPNPLLRRPFVPVVPDVPGLKFQAVHSYDVGEAYRLATTTAVSGAFNITAEPPLGPADLADLFGARLVAVPPRAVRAMTDATWKLRLQPTPPGWLDMALQAPLMSARRAREELGWAPEYSAKEALVDLLEGMRDGAGFDTPPLHPRTGGRMRIKELTSGLGSRLG